MKVDGGVSREEEIEDVEERGWLWEMRGGLRVKGMGEYWKEDFYNLNRREEKGWGSRKILGWWEGCLGLFCSIKIVVVLVKSYFGEI